MCLINHKQALKSKLIKIKKISNSLREFAWRCVATANQCWHSPDVIDVPKAQTYQRLDIE